MARVLLVWEMGANMGHMDRLLLVARALRARGHEVRLLLRDLSRAHSRVAAAGFAMGQAPVWLPRMANPPRLGNYAAVLAAAGWLDAPGLAALLCGWRDAYGLAQPDVVVCEHAPTALLALRGTGIPAVAVGDSFLLPPAAEHFPPMLPEQADEAGRCAGYDATVLAPTNQALHLLGEAPLARLTELFSGVRCALASLPELAHYSGYPAGTEWVGPSFVGDLGVVPVWPEGSGPRVFAYLDPMHAEFTPTLAALKALAAVTLVHAKGLSPQAAAMLGGPHIRFEAAPVQLGPAVAAAQVVVSHASMGTATAAALAGKPQLALPSHQEQSLVARRLLQAGVALQVEQGRSGVDVKALLQRLFTQAPYTMAAQALAARHAGATPQATGERLADVVEAALSTPPTCPP